jgi:hypothetical protein
MAEAGVEKSLPLYDGQLSKAFSDSARIAALEARRAKALGGGYVQKLDANGHADVSHMLAAVDSRKTKSGHAGHNPGEAFNPEKVTSDERGILELAQERLNPLDIARALALDFKETRDKMRGWRLISSPTQH